MRRDRLKLALWALMALLALAGAWLAVAGAGRLVAHFQQGADPASALKGEASAEPIPVALRWLPDAEAEGRPLDDFRRRQIGTAYLEAWQRWSLALAGGGSADLSTTFGGPMLAALEASTRPADGQASRLGQFDLAHSLALRFFSDDGQIVAFEDRDARLVHELRGTDGEAIVMGEHRASFEVVMLLEDGRWRVRQLRQTDSAPSEPATLASPGRRLDRAGRAPILAGVDYYPQATPWDRFWPEFEPEIVAADFARIRGLGLNAIRVFVPYEGFGGATVAPAMLARLDALLQAAAAQELQVIVTLMDFWTGYAPASWAAGERHLEQLLPLLAASPAVLAVDLKNQPDLDDDRQGRARVDAWLAHAAGRVHALEPGLRVTIGWSSPEAARRLADRVDLVSFHYYGPAEGLPAAYASLRRAVPDRPILLTETGLPTWNPVWFPGGHSEAEQAAYLSNLLLALRSTDASGYLVWTLYDFEHVPAAVAPWPWRAGHERHLGLLRADGSAKPAATLLAPGATLAHASAPGPLDRFLKPFWLLVFGLALLCLLAAWLGLRQGRAQPKPPLAR